jgi:hypothetical protein
VVFPSVTAVDRSIQEGMWLGLGARVGSVEWAGVVCCVMISRVAKEAGVCCCYGGLVGGHDLICGMFVSWRGFEGAYGMVL